MAGIDFIWPLLEIICSEIISSLIRISVQYSSLKHPPYRLFLLIFKEHRWILDKIIFIMYAYRYVYILTCVRYLCMSIGPHMSSLFYGGQRIILCLFSPSTMSFDDWMQVVKVILYEFLHTGPSSFLSRPFLDVVVIS